MGDTHPTPAENTSPTSLMLEGREPTDPGNDIDDRMDALLADHKEMGARPADDVTVAEARSDPAKRASAKEMTDGRNVMPASTTKATRKPRAKKSK